MDVIQEILKDLFVDFWDDKSVCQIGNGIHLQKMESPKIAGR